MKENDAVSLLLNYLKTLLPAFYDVHDDGSMTVAANSICEVFQWYSDGVANLRVVQLPHAPLEARKTIILTTFIRTRAVNCFSDAT